MSYTVLFDPKIENDIANHLRAGNKKLVVKIEVVVSELAEHPRSGTGKPEQLRYFDKEIWSRRIDKQHRLIYEIKEQTLVVIAISAYGHYGNK